MVHYAGTLDKDNNIVSWRAIYSKYDETGTVIPDSFMDDVNPKEVMLPIMFAELFSVTDYKLIDGELVDPDTGNVVQLSDIFGAVPTLMQVQDKSDFTRYEYMWLQHDRIFHTPLKPFWNDPKLYYIDVSDDFQSITGVGGIGGVMYIFTHEMQKVKLEGVDNIKNIIEKFLEMKDVEEVAHSLVRAWANGDGDKEKMLQAIDQVNEAMQEYL